MRIIKRYIAYLKDNPERYWFKRKLYGWGWTPARWQGWFVTVLAAAAIVVLALRAERLSSEEAVVNEALVPIVVIVIALIGISYWKGEKPRWQWGEESRGDSARSSEENLEQSE